MGTVKYTGPVASFHCPTEATIRSLKVHFSPKQEGSGDPSPENVREIVGWDGVEVEQRGKNLFDAGNAVHTSTNCWVSSNAEHKITASNVDRTIYIPCLPNTTYTISKSVGNVLGVGYTTVLPEAYVPTFSYYRDNSARVATVTTGADAKYLAIWYYDGSKAFDKTVTPEYIYRTLQVELGSTATSYEPYRGSTTNYTFGVLGKNKWDEQWEIGGISTTTGLPNNETNRIRSKNYIPIVPNTTYYWFTSGSQCVGFMYDENYNLLTWPNETNKYKIISNNTFTTPEECRYFKFYCSASYGVTYNNDIALNYPSTATTYEPYNPNHTVYGGWVDLISGEVCEEWINFPLVSSLNWNKAGRNSSGVYFYYENSNAGERCLWSAGQYQIINAREKYTHGKVENPWSEVGNNAWAYWATNNTTIRLSYSDDMNILSVDDLKDWLDEQGNVSICYPLATPNTYTLAPTQLQTFLGTNNVWSNADYVEIEYDLHETQDILARKQFIMASQPHVEEASGAIATFTTDMAAKLKECKVGFKPVQEGEGDPSPENVRAISGWNGIEINQCSENLFPAGTYTRTQNGITFTYYPNGDVHVEGTSTAAAFLNVPSSMYFTITPGTYTISGNKNDSNINMYLVVSTDNGGDIKFYTVSSTPKTQAINFTDNYARVQFAVATGKTVNVTVHPRLERSETTSGIITSEITFPAVGKNLFDEKYPNIYSALIYRSIYVGDNVVTASSDMPLDTRSYSNLFILPGIVTSGAGTTVNDFNAVRTRTVQPIDGYITIAYRYDGGVDPRDYHTQIEVGSTATTYEPYSLLYGGYVDLTTGEVWKTHEKINILAAAKQGTWDSTAGKGAYWYTSGIQTLATTNDGVLCNRCTPISNTTLENTTSVISWYPNSIIRWIDIGTMEMTVAEYRNYLAENPLQVIYKLNTPVLVETLSPSQLKSLRGINNIYSNTNDNITVKYWKH